MTESPPESPPRKRGLKKGCKRNPNSGRKTGTPNKITRDLREMVHGALDRLGGEDYLVKKAKTHPQAFLALIGRCIPKDVHISGQLTLADLVRAAIGAEKPESTPSQSIQ